jgi:hypothetical protein
MRRLKSGLPSPIEKVGNRRGSEIVEETTQSLATLNLSGNGDDFVAGFNDLVSESLMVAFDVIMFEIVIDSPDEYFDPTGRHRKSLTLAPQDQTEPC